MFGTGLRQLNGDLIHAPLEPVLHPSRWRLKWIGLFALFGNPLFGWIWYAWLPQPWENIWLRTAVTALGLPLVFDLWPVDVAAKSTKVMFSLICWLQLPVFFSWMYLCNSGNTVWLASVVAMILIYYHVTDWRLASVGVAAGGFVAWLLFLGFGPPVPAITGLQARIDMVVIGFSWAAALALGFSAANLRRDQLKHTLTTMGIMAHELRTPLATMSLVGDALRGEARLLFGDESNTKVDKLAQKLHALVRNMNHQIDTQIVNARLLRLPHRKEAVSAAQLMRETIHNYPYRSSRERECVELHVRRDFSFKSSHALFLQVMDNLIKNALKSLAAAEATTRPGDLTIEVGILHNKGRIVIADRGVGINPQLQPRIFEPFFSTDRGTGHGLGLALCRRVILGLNGSIAVQSEAGKGATFTIELPLLT